MLLLFTPFVDSICLYLHIAEPRCYLLPCTVSANVYCCKQHLILLCSKPIFYFLCKYSQTVFKTYSPHTSRAKTNKKNVSTWTLYTQGCKNQVVYTLYWSQFAACLLYADPRVCNNDKNMKYTLGFARVTTKWRQFAVIMMLFSMI